MHRPAFARLILGRWKKRSFRTKPPSLPILQGIYPDRPKDSEIHFDTLAPSAKIKKVEKTSQETLQKKKQNSQMYTQILSKNELVINAEEEKEEEEEDGKKRKQKQKNEWTW